MNITWCVNIPFPAVCRRLGLPVGGSGWWMVALARRLAAEPQLKLTVITAGPRYGAAQRFEDGGVTYSVLPARQAELVGIRSSGLLARLAAEIDASSPDIVDIHGTEFCYGQVTPRLNAPVAVTLQGVMADIMPRFFADVGMVPALCGQMRGPGDVRSLLLSLYSHMLGRLRARQERKVFAANRNYIGRTDWDHGCQRRFAPAGRYFYCHRILRPEFNGRNWRPERLAERRILCVSAPEVYKGTHVLIEALHRLQGEFPEARLALGGQFGQHGWGGYLRRQIRRHHLEGKVEFLGYLTPDAIAQQAEGASVFVAPSFIENECIALAEAMRVGLPCVASAAGGMTSTVRDGHDGLHFAPGDSAALARHLARIFSDPPFATELGAHAQATAIERHDPERVLADALANYRAIVGKTA